LTALSVGLSIAFAQVDNDIVDRNLDRYDKPNRPLTSGRVPPRPARFLAGATAIAALIVAIPLGGVSFLWVAGALLASSVYSRRWKNTVFFGNVIVALLASSAYTYGAVAAAGPPSKEVGVVQTMLFSVVLTHEVVKTILDLNGDREAGLRTIATRLGMTTSSHLAGLLALISALVSLVPSLDARFPAVYLFVTGITLCIPSMIAAWSLAFRVRYLADIERPFLLLRLAWSGMVLAALLA
jgi:4-hydroxybenzoate polyprenyltransferase